MRCRAHKVLQKEKRSDPGVITFRYIVNRNGKREIEFFALTEPNTGVDRGILTGVITEKIPGYSKRTTASLA